MTHDNETIGLLNAVTVQVVSAYVANNSLPASEMPALISSVTTAFSRLKVSEEEPAEAAPLVPAVPVRKSVTDDYIICLEDGKQFKSLKRHLATKFQMTPAEYRKRWSLPSDYPMVAPAYAASRSDLAKRIGLGKKRMVPTPVRKRKAAAG